MKRLAYVLALLVAALARFDGLSAPPAAAQTTTAVDGTARAVTAANAFLATLSPVQRSSVLLELRQDLQSRWSNLPTGTVMQVDRERTKTPLPRNGLRLGDLTAAQRDAVQVLLRATLSAEGVQKVNDIVASDEEQERRAGPSRPPTAPVRFGRAEYYVAILGTPSTSAPWMLQFGGHHLAINVSYAGANRTLAPSHLGAQPALFTLESRTVRPLGDEVDKAVALLNALDAKQRQQATLNYAVADTVLAAGSDGKTIEPEGVRASTFSRRAITLCGTGCQERSDLLRPIPASDHLQAPHHLQEHADLKRLTRNNGGCVRHQGSRDECLALIHLRVFEMSLARGVLALRLQHQLSFWIIQSQHRAVPSKKSHRTRFGTLSFCAIRDALALEQPPAQLQNGLIARTQMHLDIPL
jgi:hypothetical protein